jgi:hypothetical protein
MEMGMYLALLFRVLQKEQRVCQHLFLWNALPIFRGQVVAEYSAHEFSSESKISLPT